MKKILISLAAASFFTGMAGAAFAQESTAPTPDNSRVAAADSAAFSKLDADADGRVSAIEAANDSKVAAGFTQADIDKDGYLSKAEFMSVGKSSSSRDEDTATPTPRSDTTLPESSTTPPQ